MKKPHALKLAPFILVSLLTGCNSEPVNDVQYYIDNKAERKAKLKECRNDPGTLKDNPNCINAEQAAHRVLFDSSKTSMPSID